MRAAWVTGITFALLSSVAFSTKAVMAKLAYRYGVDGTTVLALRMAFALPAYVVVFVIGMRERGPLEKGDVWKILGLGAIGYYLASLFDFLGLEYISAGLERLILFTHPTLVAVFEAVFFGRSLGRRGFLALVVTYAGIAAVFASEAKLSGEGLTKGAILVSLSSVAYASYLVGSGRMIPRIGAERFTSLSLIVSSLAVLLHALVTGHSLRGLPTQVYGLGLGLAVIATVLPTFLLAWAIRRVGSGPAAIVGTVGPVSTIVLANIFLAEPIHAFQIFGAVLVLAGATLIAIPELHP